MPDKYGYLANPGMPQGNWLSRNKKLVVVIGGTAMVALAVGLIIRARKGAGKKVEAKPNAVKEVIRYTVTAPTSPLKYSGTGMPFGIQYWEPLPETHVEVDNNGIGRLFTNDERPGGIVQANGNSWFVEEGNWNEALYLTRLLNASTLLKVLPFSLVSSGYVGYVTTGPHVGQSVFITLNGQVGMVLYALDGGQETYVPLELIDNDPTIWSQYGKPYGG